MSIVAIARELDVHPNTVRFHLDTLVSDGRVEQVALDHKGPGRPPLMFQATRQMDRGGPRRYRLLAEILTMGFAADRDPRAKALAAGRAWGRRLKPPTGTGVRSEAGGPLEIGESIEQLMDVLDELGFAPERRGETQVGLRHCPFLELAEASPAVVCPIHLGLMQGMLETWQAPIKVDRLDSFAEPDLCLAHLGPQGTAR
ncbi:helix-turn-helix transcriptional regulator [Mycobacterium sp.]|uniref:helix-turn-helix transcriptional regulator n=1 Tax=Mycobacterium sp. TaxID=1785 RepID=UPI003D6A4F55